MKIYFGLGNYEKKYQKTRHNIGHQVIYKICPNLDHNSQIGVFFCRHQDSIFAISDGYMNNSGEPLGRLARFYKIDPANITVIHDDLDLGVGEWRHQFDRGSAGHNGIKSVIDHLGTQSFWRYRVGIDHPRNTPNPAIAVEDYVLTPFTPTELETISQTIDKIVADIKPGL